MASIPKIKLCQIGKQTVELTEIEDIDIFLPTVVKKKDQDLIRSTSKKLPSFLKTETVIPWSELGLKKEDEEMLAKSILFPVEKKKVEKSTTRQAAPSSKRYRAFKNNIGKLFIDTNHLNIIFKPVANRAQIEELFQTYGMQVKQHFTFAPFIYLVEIAEKFDTLTLSFELSNHELIDLAEPDFLENIGLRFTPTDPLYNLQWHYHNLAGPPPIGIGNIPQKSGAHINAEGAWDYTQGNGVTVAFHDYSFDVTHPDLNVDNALSAFYTGPTVGGVFNPGLVGYPVPPAAGDHGTNCAGMIGANANNGAGGAGAAILAQLRLITNAWADVLTTQSSLARALAYAADPSTEIPGANPNTGAQVIGCSEGPNSGAFLLSGTLQTAIEFATREGRGGRGVPIFWATDNGTVQVNIDGVCSHSDTVAVGRSWWADAHHGSSYGPELDLIAPGVEVMTTDWGGPGSTYTNVTAAPGSDGVTGCSFSAPLTAGVAALVLADKFEPTSNLTNLIKKNNSLSWVEVKELLSIASIPIGLEIPMTNVSAIFPAGAINHWQDAAGNSILNPNGTLNPNGPNTSLNGAVVTGATTLVVAANAGFQKRQAIMVGTRTALTGGATGTGANLVINVGSSANFTIGDAITIRSLDSSILISTTGVVPPPNGPLNTISIQDTTGFQAGDWVRLGNPGNFDFLRIVNILDHSTFSINPAITPITLFQNWLTNTPIVRVNAPPGVQNPIVTSLVGAIVTDVPNGMSLEIDNVPNNFPNARNTIVELQGTEVRAIRTVSPDGTSIAIDSLQNAHPNNCPVIGGFVPFRSDVYGRGRLDALSAVLESIDYQHSQRDLVIRKSTSDDGLSTTDVTLADVNTPDVWIRTTNPVNNAFAGDPGALPATYTAFGPHQKIVLGNPSWIYSRVRNIGTLYNSLDYSVRNYLALSDGTIPFTTQDFRHSYQGGGTIANDTLGTHFIGQSRVFNDARFTIPAPNIQTVGGTSIAPGATQSTAVNWPAATRPTIPLPAPSAELLAVTTGAGTARVHNANRFQVNQVVLVDLPGMGSYASHTITGILGDTISFMPALPAALPVTTKITGLTAAATTMPVAAAAGSEIAVADASGFGEGQYLLIGAPGTATNEIHQIQEIDYTPANHKIILTAPLANVAAHIITTPVTLIQGDPRLYVLSEITPYDGELAGTNVYDNNNVTFKEVFLGHKISFLDSGPGTTALTDKTQVNNLGGLATVGFRVRIEDSANFTTENVRIFIHRIHVDGTTETATYVHQAPGGGGPAVWTLIPAVPGWATITPPTLTAGGAAAAGVQTDITFSGTYEVSNLHTQVRIACNVPGVLPGGGGAYISTRSHPVQVFSIAGLPDGVPSNDIQNGTGTQSLAGTQAIHAFADTALLEQTQPLTYGIKNTNQFRLTSSFTTTSNPGVDVRAFAVLDSLVFIQHNVADNLINVILRPLRQARIGFTRVKYFIYRGLRADDFISAGNPLELRASTGLPIGNFVDSVNQVQTDRGVVGAVPLTALGWDPTNQNIDDYLDNYFYSTNPDQQLPVVKRGMSLGRFNNATPASEFGFEIVLAEGNYPITLGNLRAKDYTLDVSGISNADEKLAKREEILNYIDPCAYFGMHFYSGVEAPDVTNVDPNVIQTFQLREVTLYDRLVSKFFTKNTLYVDVRNESGYSYNFYDNYNFQGAGADNGKSFRNGNTPPDVNPLVARLYETQGWPILVQDVSADPITSDNDFNTAFLQLVKNDNGDPIIYIEYGYAITGTSNNSNYFIQGTELQNQSVVDAIAGDVITVRDALGGTINVGDVVHLNSNEHNSSNTAYTITAIAANAGNALFTDLTMQVGTVDAAAAAAPVALRGNIAYGDWLKPIGFSYPNVEAPGNAAKRLDVSYCLKLRYCRHVNPFVRDIVGVTPGTSTFTVRGNIINQLSAGQSILVREATVGVGGVTNNNSYTIATGGIAPAGANTSIQVIEPVPAGTVDGEIVVDPKRVIKTSRYTDNAFGPLAALVRPLPITALTVNGAGSSTLTLSGNYVQMIPINSSVSIIDSANNNGRYNVNNAVLNGPNTEITIDTAGALNGTLDGKLSFIHSIWSSEKPTKWITGFDRRYVDLTNDPLLDPTHALHDYNHLGQTGIAVENQRAIFFINPIDFFTPPNDANSLEVINMNGGLSDKDSFWGAMQFQNQRLSLNTTLLRVNPGGGEILIPIFDFEDVPGDADTDIKKENFMALCLTKVEINSLTDAAQAGLLDYHDVFFVLRNEQQLTDLNATDYRKYEVRVAGHGKNPMGEIIAKEVVPTTPIYVYAQEDDRVIFTSEDFANLEILTNPVENYEEAFRNQQVALDLLASNPPLQVIVDSFHTDLNTIDKDYLAIRALTEAFGELLWEQAAIQAGAAGAAPYEDRSLYWARLHMRASLRNHPYLLKQKRRLRKCLDLLEQHSRGLQTVDFAPGAGADYKVLVLGFDPFGLASNIAQSNPSGAIALHLHGETITNAASGETAYVQTAMFPVRYKEFNDGMVEKFIKPFMDGTTPVDMIISCSQDGGDEFNIDRFASKFRHPDLTDNVNQRGEKAKFYGVRASGKLKRINKSKLPEFIETALPFADMIAPGGTLPNTRVIYDQSYEAKNPDSAQAASAINSGIVKNPPGIPAGRASKGSGGFYLSNEIFYRIAYLRTILPGAPPTGHLHVPILQKQLSPAYSLALTTTLVNDAQTIIEDALDGI